MMVEQLAAADREHKKKRGLRNEALALSAIAY
jgi:hypothetical protein